MKRSLNKPVCILLFLFTVLGKGFTQRDPIIFRPVNHPVLDQYDIRQVTAANDGKLWLSTGNGLLLYDGNDVRIFLPDQKDSTTLSGHSLSRTFLDRHGNLFVVIISDGQIDYFNSRTGEAERFKLKIEREDSSGFSLAYPFLDIYIENDSSIWAGRTNMGFIHFNPITKSISNYSLLSEINPGRNTVYNIQQDGTNSDLLWLATDYGIFSFNKKSRRLERHFRCSNNKDSTSFDPDIRRLHIKNKDTIWFASHLRGVGCLDVRTGKYTIFPSMKINSQEEEILFLHYFQYAENDEYLVSLVERTPCFFNTGTKQYSFPFKIEHTKNSMLGGHFRADLFELPAIFSGQAIVDNQGTIWGNFYGKLYIGKQFKNNFKSIPIQDKYYKDQYTNIFKKVIWDQEKEVFYVAFHLSDGIFVFDKDINPVKTIIGPPFNNGPLGWIESVVIDIGLDKNNRLWMCGNIISIYDSVSQKMVPISLLYPGLASLNQRFRNLVFHDKYLYAVPANPLSTYLYRIDVDRFTCDSIGLPAIPIAEKQQPNQLGPLEMDSKGENIYLSNKNAVFQYSFTSRQTRKIIELTDLDKPYAHFSNFHWYNVDDNDNIWVSSLTKTWIFEPIHLKVIKEIQRKKNTYFNQAHNLKGKGMMCYVNSTSYDFYDYRNQKEYNLGINDGLISYINWSTSFANEMLFIGANNYFQYIPFESIVSRKTDRKCYLSEIRIFNRQYTADTLPEYLHFLKLPHHQNFITLTFSSTEFEKPEALEYRYKMDGVNEDWVYTNYHNRTISFNDLRPGSYTFHTSIKNLDGTWRDNEISLKIRITPAWWQTVLFKVVVFVLLFLVVFWLVRWRIRVVRRQEQLRSTHEKELLELEAKALRAQMNPHFIFNCLNSIKALMQENEMDKGVTYLTTFSKLIRTLFNNADKKEISLYDEMETCKLYLQLEAMRFDSTFSYHVSIDEAIDLKSISVPALIIQPFIENAIWHGIVPKGKGGNVSLEVNRRDGNIEIVIDDNGIGRESSQQNKAASHIGHQSKGVNLTQSRLELDNLLQQRKAKLETYDKRDESGKAIGTKVVIILPQEE